MRIVVSPPMSEVVITKTEIEREPVRYLPVILDECSCIKPAQDLIQVGGQSPVCH